MLQSSCPHTSAEATLLHSFRMSLRDKHNRSGGRFSSLSLDSYSIPKIRARNLQGSHITAVTFNKNLLTPVRIGIDPTVQDVRTQEKDQLKSLNNRFVSFIEKVRYLEQQNKILETKWKLLEEKKVPSSEVEPMMKSYIAKLQRQLDFLQTGKAHLEAASIAMHKNVEDYKTKYENELSKRDDAEYEFVRIKKEVDASYLCMLEVEKQLAGVGEEFNFFKTLYAQEFLELQNTLKETSVVVKMDNSRGLDMNQIIADVKDQYEDVAARSREEAETWHKNKIDQMSAEADLHGNDLRRTKMEIADINRIIRRLQNQILAVQKQCTSLETQTTEAEQHGERAVKDAKDHIRDLELALQRAKQNMARQIRDFQELMNVKLALDIEISTYRKLLEGEEDRIEQPLTVSIQK